jgi:Ni/Co efflux regulator RcnB
VSFGDAQIQKLADADTAIKQLDASWKGFVTTLTAAVAPSLTTALKFWSGAPRDIYEQVADLEDKIASLQSSRGAGSGSAEKTKKLADLQAQLKALREQAKQASMRDMGIGEKPTAAVGFGAEEAAAAAKNAAEKSAKEMEKFLDGYHDSLRDMNADVDRESDEQLKRDGERWMERQDQARDTYDKWKQGEKEVAEWREHQWEQSAAVFRDYFVNAIEDMINTGKFQWRGFLSFIAAEFAKKQFGKLFDSIFSGSSGGGGGGLFSSIVGAIAGGAASGAIGSGSAVEGRASGGSVRAGQTYLVGESGMELFKAPSNGSIVPNHALGGGPSVTVVNHIDARGATVDAVKLLPSFGKQISEQTEARIVERLRHNYYELN